MSTTVEQPRPVDPALGIIASGVAQSVVAASAGKRLLALIADVAAPEGVR